LNCEGGEVAAFQQLVRDPELRARIPQVCSSFHCDHVKIYPREVGQDCLNRMIEWYEIRRNDVIPNIPYFLMTRKVQP
jgi:hypothetical protein